MNIFKTAVLRVLLLSIFSVSVLTVNAGGILRVKPVEESGKAKAVISFANIDAKNVTMSIEDIDRETVYYHQKFTNELGFAKIFDLTSLEDGMYVINVKAGNEVLSETVQIVNSELSLKDSIKLLEPIFRVTDDVLLVYFQRGGSDFYGVNFYDNTGNFFTDDLESTTAVKKYSLENLPDGEYTVSVSGATASFSYDFIKD